MDERTIREKMQNAMQRPSAPAALVERTRQSARAVEMGKTAKEQLLKQGAPLGDRTAELAAKMLVGKMAQNRILPAGVTAEALTGQLMQNAAFRREITAPAETLVKSIEDGSMVRRLARKREPEKNAQPERNMPQKKQEPPQL